MARRRPRHLKEGQALHVFDSTGLPPRQLESIRLRDQPGWITFSLDGGSTIELSFQGSRLTGRVQPAWDPPLYTNQDTLPRPPAESPMKEFRPLKLGTLRLERGRGPLTLRAREIPGNEVMRIRAITLTLIQISVSPHLCGA